MSAVSPYMLPISTLLLLSYFEQQRIWKEAEIDRINNSCTSVHHFDPNNNDKLVHLVSTIQIAESSVVLDELFPYIQSERSVTMKRIVEFFQYQEKGKKEYSLVWTPNHIDSSQFKDLEKCNKRSNIASITNYNNMSVTCGGYMVNRALISDLDNYTTLNVGSEQMYHLSQYFGSYGSKIVQHNNWIYIFPPEYSHMTCSPTEPPVNTMRLKFEVTSSCVVSVIGKQSSYDIVPWFDKGSNRDVHSLYVGTQPVTKMLQVTGNITSSITRIVAILMLWFLLDCFSTVYGTALPPNIYAYFISHTMLAAILLVTGTIALNYLFFKPVYSFIYITIALVWFYFVVK